jgi:hypothetical protein
MNGNDASAVKRIKQLDQERATLIEGAKKEALGRANDAMADLKALGFTYRLVIDGAVTRKIIGRKGTRTVKDGPCPVCEFKTHPLHDARKHRAQGNRKRPFTPKQLQEIGLRKV